jgi:hypothetical protein
MMDLDAYNSLSVHPEEMDGLDEFLRECERRGVSEINLTGTNTDPLLFQHTQELRDYIEDRIYPLRFGLRTNGALASKYPYRWNVFDKASVTVCSVDRDIYAQMMGRGEPPNISEIVALSEYDDIKCNIVLGPENTRGADWLDTVLHLAARGVSRFNLREPYGQPHVGDPCKGKLARVGKVYGQPTYAAPYGARVTYWDVHYCHVESVNLYASGKVSIDYPITRGHSENGSVVEQSKWTHGRHRQQWVRQ